MSALDPDELPLPQRIALAYAPSASRGTWQAMLQLDARLGSFLAQASEPLLAQMRLAWWRDNLGKPPQERPAGDPLLESIGEKFAGQEQRLIALVDGWERLLADPPISDGAVAEFVAGRNSAFLAVAEVLAIDNRTDAITDAGGRWAVADLLARSSDPDERKMLLERGLRDHGRISLPRAMRPLAILSALARRALAKRGAPLFGDRGSALLAMRVGMFGR